MSRYNNSTKTVIDMVCGEYDPESSDLWVDRYDTTDIDDFKTQVLDDFGLTDDEIDLACSNGNQSDEIYVQGTRTLMALVNWRQVMTRYRRVNNINKAKRDRVWFTTFLLGGGIKAAGF